MSAGKGGGRVAQSPREYQGAEGIVRLQNSTVLFEREGMKRQARGWGERRKKTIKMKFSGREPTGEVSP